MYGVIHSCVLGPSSLSGVLLDYDTGAVLRLHYDSEEMGAVLTPLGARSYTPEDCSLCEWAIKRFLEIPLTEMPLYLDHEVEEFRIAARARLKGWI